MPDWEAEQETEFLHWQKSNLEHFQAVQLELFITEKTYPMTKALSQTLISSIFYVSLLTLFNEFTSLSFHK